MNASRANTKFVYNFYSILFLLNTEPKKKKTTERSILDRKYIEKQKRSRNSSGIFPQKTRQCKRSTLSRGIERCWIFNRPSKKSLFGCPLEWDPHTHTHTQSLCVPCVSLRVSLSRVYLLIARFPKLQKEYSKDAENISTNQPEYSEKKWVEWMCDKKKGCMYAGVCVCDLCFPTIYEPCNVIIYLNGTRVQRGKIHWTNESNIMKNATAWLRYTHTHAHMDLFNEARMQGNLTCIHSLRFELSKVILLVLLQFSAVTLQMIEQIIHRQIIHTHTHIQQALLLLKIVECLYKWVSVCKRVCTVSFCRRSRRSITQTHCGWLVARTLVFCIFIHPRIAVQPHLHVFR